jgi:CheY-like chemotaxis protein
MKILIVEDDPVSMRVLEAFLEDWGYEVVTARSGNQARELLKEPALLKDSLNMWRFHQILRANPSVHPSLRLPPIHTRGSAHWNASGARYARNLVKSCSRPNSWKRTKVLFQPAV